LKKPLLDEVAPGKVVVGHELGRDLNLSEGDTIQLKGKDFTVSEIHSERGSVDDVTVWINLGVAQEMLGMQNQINAIMALECGCSGDRISQIRAEIADILPGTQVIERYSQAVTRSESRAKAKDAAEAALQQAEAAGAEQLALEQRSRQDIEERHAAFASILVPLVVLGSIVTIGLLALMNSRQRSQEIGILRAIGLSTRQLMTVFLSKAAIIGLLGGLAGVCAGMLIGQAISSGPSGETHWNELLATNNLSTVALLAPVGALLLAGLASWIPALLAARQDPATVLQRD